MPRNKRKSEWWKKNTPKQSQRHQHKRTRAIRRKPKTIHRVQRPPEQTQKPCDAPLFNKTLYEIGDRIMAKWLDNNLWYNGKVHDFRIVRKSLKYGEVREYHIKFSDGDEDPKLSEEYVWSPYEYQIAHSKELTLDFLNKRGIKLLFDPETNDPYARKKGYFQMNMTGPKLFGSYMDVFHAHDEAFIQRNDPSEFSISKEYLFYPENWEISKGQIVSKASNLGFSNGNDSDEDTSCSSSVSDCSIIVNEFQNEMIVLKDANEINDESKAYLLNGDKNIGSNVTQGAFVEENMMEDFSPSISFNYDHEKSLENNQHIKKIDHDQQIERKLYEKMNKIDSDHKLKIKTILEKMQETIEGTAQKSSNFIINSNVHNKDNKVLHNPATIHSSLNMNKIENKTAHAFLATFKRHMNHHFHTIEQIEIESKRLVKDTTM